MKMPKFKLIELKPIWIAAIGFVLSSYIVAIVEFNSKPFLINVNWSLDNITVINRFLVTMSYSYISGIILYAITSLLPLYEKKKRYKGLIYGRIKNIYSDSLYNYIIAYYHDKYPSSDIINRYIQGEGKQFTSLFEEVYSTNNTEHSLKLELIESIHKYFKEFSIFYNSYNIYMNTKQVVLINKMISEQYTEKAFKLYKNLPEEESLTKEQLDKYIILVDQLFSSVI